MNDNGRSRESVLNGATAKLLGSNDSRRIQVGLLALLAAMALVLPCDCASVALQGDPAPWQYHPNTGPPAVGDGLSWHP